MAEPEVVESPHPALFELRDGETLVAHGVRWPDGAVSAHWVEDDDYDASWSDLDDMASDLRPPLTVVWRRQDTYAG